MKDMNKSFIIGLIAAIILVLFAIQNAGSVEIKLLAWNTKSSLALVLLIAFAIGSIVGYLMTFSNVRGKSKELKNKKEEIKSLNTQIENLKKHQNTSSFKDQSHDDSEKSPKKKRR